MKKELKEKYISEEGDNIVDRMVDLFDDLTDWAITAAAEYLDENEDTGLSWQRLVKESRKALWYAMINYDPDDVVDYYKYIIEAVKTELLTADLIEYTKKRTEKILARKNAGLIPEIRKQLISELGHEPSSAEIAARAAATAAGHVHETLKRLAIHELRDEIIAFREPAFCYADNYSDTDDESFFF